MWDGKWEALSPVNPGSWASVWAPCSVNVMPVLKDKTLIYAWPLSYTLTLKPDPYIWCERYHWTPPLALCSVVSPQNTGRNCHQKWASEYIPYTELQTPQLLTQWLNLWLLNFHANLSFINESKIMTVNSVRKRTCVFSTPFYLWARCLAHCSKPERSGE